MEIQFQQQQQKKGKMSSKFKAKNNGNNSKFVGVRQRPSGRWVAEIKDTTQKIRMWLGTFETAEAAAHAYDEAACLLRGSNTRTNFVTHVSQNSPLASRIRNLLNNKKSNEKKISLDTSSSSSTNTASITTTSITSTISNSTSNTSNSISWTNGNSTTSSPTSSHDDFSFDEKVNDPSQLFDDAYKPELSHYNEDFNLKVEDPSHLFDGAYTPDLSHCNNDFYVSSSCHSNNMPWGYGKSNMIDHLPFAQEMLDLPKNVILMPETEMEFSEFDRMKVERQISASLYAMNGVHEYMETIHEAYEAIWDLPPLCETIHEAYEAIWDLPPLCPLFC